MNYDVTINGRPWRVAIEPASQPGQFQVSVKGRRQIVDAAWIDAETLSLIPTGDGSTSERATVRELGIHVRAGEMDVVLEGTAFRARSGPGHEPAAGAGRPSTSSGRSEPVEGRQAITAPMPGRIVRVLVAPGDRVSAGQAVITVEAMKMENEMRSPKDGVVGEIRVREGTAIEAGAVLVVIE
jgi:biotin carboxyl carrier protein